MLLGTYSLVSSGSHSQSFIRCDLVMSLLALTLFLSAEIKCRPIAGTPKACLNLPQTPLCAGRSLSHCRPRLIPGMSQFSLTSGLLYSKSPLLEPGSSDSDTVSLTHPDLGSYDPLQRSLTFSPQGPCLVTVLNKESCACPARLLSDSWVLVSVACQLPSTFGNRISLRPVAH